MTAYGDTLGSTRYELLKMLQLAPEGETVDRLADGAQITKSAVRQHLTALERDGFVARGAKRPSGGRPEQLFVLTEAGQEQFPRQYSWFSELLLASLAEELGEEDLERVLTQMGQRVGQSVHEAAPAAADMKARIRHMVAVMRDKGYDAALDEHDELQINAGNCVFHALALRRPAVCQFDIALLERGCGGKVEHTTCMARGEDKCRFKFSS